jgi:hypothetical protein
LLALASAPERLICAWARKDDVVASAEQSTLLKELWMSRRLVGVFALFFLAFWLAR